jgi:general secretion pathway protein C
VQDVDLNTAPANTLTLELQGLIASSDERIAHAIIGDSSGQQHLYFLRAAVPGGAVVASILPDRVILDRGGQLEALILPRTRNPNTLVGDSSPSFPGGSSTANSTPLSVMAEEQPVARSVRLADIMMSRPHLQRGEFRGVEVYPGEQATQFSNLGLKPGDVVTAIDGRPLTSSNAAAPFEGVAASTSLTLTLERQGKARTLRIVNGQPVAPQMVKPQS